MLHNSGDWDADWSAGWMSLPRGDLATRAKTAMFSKECLMLYLSTSFFLFMFMHSDCCATCASNPNPWTTQRHAFIVAPLASAMGGLSIEGMP